MRPDSDDHFRAVSDGILLRCARRRAACGVTRARGRLSTHALPRLRLAPPDSCSKLINLAQPETVDERALNTP